MITQRDRPFLIHFSSNLWNYIAIYDCKFEESDFLNRINDFDITSIRSCVSLTQKKSDEELLPILI